MRLICLLVLLASPALAQETPCSLTVRIVTGSDHGSLPQGTPLVGEVTYTPTGRMEMGSETVSYPSDGSMVVRAPDGSRIIAEIGFIHVVRAPHWADYISFDMTDVSGDLGGVTDYEDPMLLTFYAARGSLDSFELPRGAEAWEAFDGRRTFQVHTPDTMWVLPGVVEDPVGTCAN